ncbi:fibronectin type III domain-containing protein [Fodinibius halophilus]|uniref:Fibronectin type III domain-containing protein n=1 Tax=Fodinibius halophilus TaxID=1736908 RepID=A0A6M1THU1_9BACT|nr:fibronectin type III domain-containing protein [Fodinibius halophilus]NGP89672.1 fibronectin type III domain-containing protein [Fodinibius halophilus]
MSESSKYLYRGVHRLVIVVVIAAIGLLSCDIVDSVQEDPSDPDRDNPRDPQSENAQPPIANITSHDATQSFVINNHTVSISWEPDTSGVAENIEYQYRLAQPGQDIEDQHWQPSGWISDNSIELSYLDESFPGENYNFQIKARSSEDTTLVQSEPSELAFSVNAISDRGIVLQPRKIQQNEFGLYSTELWLDEIETTDTLTVVQAEIEIPSNQLEVKNIEIFADDRSLLLDSGGEVTDMVSIDQNTGRISISIGVLGGTPEKIEGYGKIGQITFTETGTADSVSEIAIQPGSIFFNGAGESLGIAESNLDSGIFMINSDN